MSAKDNIDLSIFLKDYLHDAAEGFDEINSALLAIEKDHGRVERLDEIFRVVHTLKSSSTMIGFSEIADLAHITEDLLNRIRSGDVLVDRAVIELLFDVTDTIETMVSDRGRGGGSKVDTASIAQRIKKLAESAKVSGASKAITGEDGGEETKESEGLKEPTDHAHEERRAKERRSHVESIHKIEKIETVRVKSDLLDIMFNLAGEFVIIRNRFNNLLAATENKDLKAALAALGRMTRGLQENVSRARLVPADEVFRRFPRMLRDLAMGAAKEVELSVVGREIELDKAVINAVGEPLIHLIRNAIDHGIETPDERERLGKQRHGTITLSARRTENHILMEVEDDGAGIDMAQMKRVAIRKGFAATEESNALRDRDILKLLFEPGFTSSEVVTEISGRGVGLDVVSTSARKLGGTVEVQTRKGKGTRFTLTLPVSTAVMQTLLVGIGARIFAIPSDVVIETVAVRAGDIKKVGEREMLALRAELLPFFELRDVLDIAEKGKSETDRLAVIISSGGRIACLGVDTVLDQMENIIKPFDPIAQNLKGFSGGTILGDGSVALVLDIPGLLGFERLQKEAYSI